MLFSSSSSFFISTITIGLLSIVNAAPITTINDDKLVTAAVVTIPVETTTGFLLTESLSEYYENIVDQVMLDVSDTILMHLPESMSHGDIEARQLAQKSLNRNLNFMRASLLASVNPLVSTDIPQIPGFLMSSIRNDELQDELESILEQSIMSLNKKMAHQLGLIVNAQQSSNILIRQANTMQQRRRQQQQQQRVDNNSSKSPTRTITVEWKLAQPFQINVIRQQQQKVEEEEQQQQQQQVVVKVDDNDDNTSAKWLFDQLSTVELNFFNEFNDRTEEAIQLVMDSLGLDF